MKSALGPPHSTGLEPMHEAIKQRQLEKARKAGWPELRIEDLVREPFGQIRHEPTGRLYRRHRGELGDLVYATATAFYLTADGSLVFLEDPPPGTPKTAGEREQRQAEREQRRAEKATKTPRR